MWSIPVISTGCAILFLVLLPVMNVAVLAELMNSVSEINGWVGVTEDINGIMGDRF